MRSHLGIWGSGGSGLVRGVGASVWDAASNFEPSTGSHFARQSLPARTTALPITDLGERKETQGQEGGLTASVSKRVALSSSADTVDTSSSNIAVAAHNRSSGERPARVIRRLPDRNHLVKGQNLY